MTYCLAATVADGLVFVSDSRTNAGIDQLGTFSKMHPFTDIPGRFFTLLSAGNLATTQAVVARLHRDVRENRKRSLATVERIREAADYVGEVSCEIQAKYAELDRSPGVHSHIVYGEDDPYLREIRESWAENLRLAFEQLPPISLPQKKVRLVDP